MLIDTIDQGTIATKAKHVWKKCLAALFVGLTGRYCQSALVEIAAAEYRARLDVAAPRATFWQL